MEDASSFSADRKRPYGVMAVGICLILLFSIYLICHKRHTPVVDPAFSK